jgi:AcrR family transcriptional regulator
MTALQAPEEVRSLPRGRHALTRQEVVASQRNRLLRAMTDEVAESGFAATTAARVYQRAGVSSRAFYENFTDVRDCFLAAYDESVRLTKAKVLASWRQPTETTAGDSLQRIGEVLKTYLELLAEEPNIARAFLLEVYAAGAEARKRRLTVHDQFVVAVRALLAPEAKLAAEDEFAIESLVDAITFRVTRALIRGDLGDIPTLRDQLLAVAVRLCPWLIPEPARG